MHEMPVVVHRHSRISFSRVLLLISRIPTGKAIPVTTVQSELQNHHLGTARLAERHLAKLPDSQGPIQLGLAKRGFGLGSHFGLPAHG